MAFNTLRGIFSKTGEETRLGERANLTGPRIPRHSTGWAAMLKHLKEGESLRVLDIGPTSPSSINLLTNLGHSIYMADIVWEANQNAWATPATDKEPEIEAQIEAFFERNLDFQGRIFDVILLWTTLDYLPVAMLEPLISRLHASMHPKGRVLAFFHTRIDGDGSIFYRYHVTEGENVEIQQADRLAVRQVHTNRKIEKLFSAYENCKFFLAKDNVYEVIVTR